jgi:hypothetical protein
MNHTAVRKLMKKGVHEALTLQINLLKASNIIFVMTITIKRLITLK